MSTSDHLDLRGLPVWERPDKVFDQFDRLPPGETFTFVVDNEPRGLTRVVEEKRGSILVIDPRRVAEREWHVTVRRAKDDGVMPSPRSVLLRTAVFGTSSDASLDALAAQSTMHTSRRGQIIHGYNANWPYIAVPFEGVFAVTNDATNSRYRIFYEITPFNIFGVASFFDGGLTPGRAIVLSKVGRYVRVPHAAILEVAAKEPDLLRNIGAVATQRTRDLMASLTSVGTTPVIARIASALLPYAIPEAGLSPALPPLPNLTQAHIAAAAGTVKEVAARSIAELETRGFLLRERGHIRFLDRTKLIDLIKESE